MKTPKQNAPADTIEGPTSAIQAFDPASITRPDPALLNYYIIVSLMTLIGAPFVFVPLLIRYKTMRYRLDEDGISMSWGFFFRREVHLTYRRLQDIHVTRNIIERWMGLAKVPIQTASGSAGATMTIEGIRNPDPLRDYLYSQMRGARDESVDGAAGEHTSDESALVLLREIRDDLRTLRAAKESGS